MSRWSPVCAVVLLPACSAPCGPAAPEPPEARPDRIWRFTTLVTGGAEPRIGEQGHHELVLDGERATVRDIEPEGPRGSPDRKVRRGSGTLSWAEDPMWPGARSGTLTVTLDGGGAATRMKLTLTVVGDELHGTWVSPEGAAPGQIGGAWGLLSGARGRGRPVVLEDGERSPCWVCHQAFFACEGMGSGACNSSNVAIAACEERVREARRSNAAVPRGCGDFMRDR